MLKLYAKLANIEQGEKKTSGKFIDRLWEALHKFTDVDLESAEGGMILKDRCLTQSAPDIFCKLWKQVFEQISLWIIRCNWLRCYVTVENIRRKIRDKKEPGERLKPQQWLLDLLLKHPEEKCPEEPG